MGLFDGKKGLVFGIANDHSIAWAITQKLNEEGAQIGFTHLPDKDPERPRMERRLRKLVEPFAKLIMPCDVQKDEDLDAVFSAAKETFGNLDFVLHSIAFAPLEDLKGPTYNVSRDGFKLSMEISVYSLISIARRSRELLNPGGSLLTLTYLGGEKVIPGYNIMGICKAALESSVEYLASETGTVGIPGQRAKRGSIENAQFLRRGRFRQNDGFVHSVLSPTANNHSRRSRQNGNVSIERFIQRHHRRNRPRRRRLPHHGSAAD